MCFIAFNPMKEVTIITSTSQVVKQLQGDKSCEVVPLVGGPVGAHAHGG